MLLYAVLKYFKKLLQVVTYNISFLLNEEDIVQNIKWVFCIALRFFFDGFRFF